MKDILPPHNMNDERGVLACILQNSELCIPDCSKVTVECFYDVFHQAIWRGITSLSRDNKPVNSLTVSRWLEQNEKIEDALRNVNELEGFSPSAYNLSFYLTSLFDYALKRRVVRGCGIISAQAMNGHTTDQIMASAEKLLSIQIRTASSILDGKEAGDKLIDDLERRYALNGHLSGLDTGFTELNKKLEGLQYGEQTLIAARPSIGKTAIGLGIFQNAVFNLKVPSLFVSLEMSTAALMRRMMSSYTNILMGDVRRGTYTEGDMKKFTAFRIAAVKSPMFIIDGVLGMSISEICVTVRRHVRKHKVRLVVIDYLQKVKPEGKHEKRTYEVADVSGKLRGLAVDTGSAFLTLAQLNRESEKDKGRSPRLSDLADSGQIERDADTVILLDRKRDEGTGEAKLIIAKQRDGETGIVTVWFDGLHCRFENYQKINSAAVPTPYRD